MSSIVTNLADAIVNDHDNDDEVDTYFRAVVPPGFIFKPTDKELILHYLDKKLANKELPRNKIKSVKLYDNIPDHLTKKYKSYTEKEWYFFTPREKIYENGSRPRRTAGDGVWKATGSETKIYSGKRDATVIGYTSILTYHNGRPANSCNKTDWIMQEYVSVSKSATSNTNNGKTTSDRKMILNDWVLCKIYLSPRNTEEIKKGKRTGNASASTESKGINKRLRTTATYGSSSSAYPTYAQVQYCLPQPQQQYHINNIKTETFFGGQSFDLQQEVHLERGSNEKLFHASAQKNEEVQVEEPKAVVPYVSSNDQLISTSTTGNNKIIHLHPVSAHVHYTLKPPQQQQQQQRQQWPCQLCAHLINIRNSKPYLMDRGEFLPAAAECDFINDSDEVSASDPEEQKKHEGIFAEAMAKITCKD